MKKLLKSFAFLMLFLVTSIVSAQNANIGGVVSYFNDGTRVLPNVEVRLFNNQGMVIANTFTNTSGFYEFQNIPFGNYVLKCSYNSNPGGIGIADALLVLKHITGQVQLTPLQYLAADVNGNGIVNMVDFLYIVIQFLVQGQSFPAGTWTFEPLAFEHTGLKDNNKKLGGASVGDVNGDFEPGNKTTPLPCYVVHEKVSGKQGEVIDVPFRIKSGIDLAAMSLTIKFDPSIAEVQEVTSPIQHLNYAIDQNFLRITAYQPFGHSRAFTSNEVFLTLTLRLLTGFSVGHPMVLDLVSESQFADKNGEVVLPTITVPSVYHSDAMHVLYPVYPNPVSDKATIGFKLADPSFAKLYLFNQQGQLVQKVMEGFQPKGYHAVDFEFTALPQGIYTLLLLVEGNDNDVMSQSVLKLAR